MWNFAKARKLIGLDRSDVNEDWSVSRQSAAEHLRSIENHWWIKQFDMFCRISVLKVLQMAT